MQVYAKVDHGLSINIAKIDLKKSSFPYANIKIWILIVCAKDIKQNHYHLNYFKIADVF